MPSSIAWKPRTLVGSRIQLNLNCLRRSTQILEVPITRPTHLAQKPLKMRQKILTTLRNPLKKRSLHPYK